MLSSELIKELTKDGTKPDTARQRLHRAFKQNLVQRTSVSFGKGQYLYFSPQEGRSRIHKKILKAIKQRRRLSRLFEALRIRKIIPEWHAAKISGVYRYVPKKRKAESLEKLLSNLEELGLGKVVDFTSGSRKCKFLVLLKECKKIVEADLKKILGTMMEEENTISRITSLIESSELGKEFAIRPTTVSVPVDALGDCKPYLRAGKEVRSKIMIEVNKMWKLNNYDLEGLLDRVHAVRKELRVYSVIVYIVADLQPSAFDWANNIGWKPLRPSRIEKITHIENMRHKGVLLLQEARPENYRNIVREIKNLDDLKNLGNYKSLWFETMVRDFFDELGYYTRGRKKYYLDDENKLTERPTKKQALEIDVFGIRTKEVKELIICECKNWLEVVDAEEIKKFVRKLNKLDDYYKKRDKK